MSTISSIGTRVSPPRNYSTITGWHGGFTNGGWIGEAYNDNPGVPFADSGLTLGGSSAPNFETLTAATGQSLFDSTSNAVAYSASLGVAWSFASVFSSVVNGSSFLTLTRFQVRAPAATGAHGCFSGATGATNLLITGNLFQDECAMDGDHSAIELNGGGVVTNNVIIVWSQHALDVRNGTGAIVNNTIVAPSDKANSLSAFFTNTAGTSVITNNAVFGFASWGITGSNATGTTNASDLATLTGTSSIPSLTYANQFAGVTSSSPNFTPKSGNSLVAGVRDNTNAPTDAFGTARPSPCTIGAVEASASSGGAGTCAGAAVVAGVGKTLKQTNGVMSGVATTNFVGRAHASVAGTCAGASVVAGATMTLRRTAGTCAAAAVVAGFGRAMRNTAATCAGVATVAGATTSRRAVAGTCAGAATVAGVGKTIKPSAAACLGAAVVFGDARAMGRMAGTCAGNSSCNGVTSGSVGHTAGTCAGAAVVSGFGARRVSAAATCAGAAFLAGVGKNFKPSAATCIGLAVFNAGGRARVPASAACVGAAVVSGATSKRIGGAGTCAGAAVVVGVSGNGGLTPTKGVIIAGATVQGYGGAVPMANYLNILEGEREYG